MRFKHLKYKLKQLTCLSLSVLTVLQTPMTSYAVESNAGGNNDQSVTTVGGGDFGVNFPTGRIGIRLSLVDSNNPSEVISVDENLQPQVLDILYVDMNTYLGFVGGSYKSALTVDNTYSAVKTQNIESVNRIRRVFYNELPFIAKPMPAWAHYDKSTYFADGVEFVNWCNTDDFNNVLIGADGLIETINSLGETIKVMVNRGMVQSENKTVSVPQYDFKDYASASRKIHSQNFMGPTKDAITVNSASFRIQLALLKQEGRVTDSEYYELNELINQKESAALKDWDKFVGGTTASRKIKSLFGGMTAYAAPGDMIAEEHPGDSNGSTETTDNPNKGDEVGAKAHINRLLALAPSENELPFLSTKSMRENNIADLTSTDVSENWVLLVEPIVYLTIFPQGYDSNPIITKQYGTISNIADAFATKPELKPYLNKKTFNWKALNGPLWKALTVKRTFTFTDENQSKLEPVDISGGIRYFGDLANWNQWGSFGENAKGGYGVNIYWRGQFSSKIKTWDDLNYPTGLPGDPPSGDKLDPESPWGIDSKKFKISKWYYFENTATGEESLYDVYTREDVPHNVAIVNEGNPSEEYFWEVVDYSTGKEDKVPEDHDTSETYEEYRDSNPGTYHGSGPEEINITPEQGDKVLYVKLVLKKFEKPEVDIVRVYEKPDGSSEVEVEHDVNVEDGKVDGKSPKPDFEYKESKPTEDPRKEVDNWDEVTPIPGDTITTEEIPVDDSDRTVYIKYEPVDPGRPNTGLILHENEISHNFDLVDAGGLVGVTRQYAGVPEPYCGAFLYRCEHEDSSDDHDVNCESNLPFIESTDWEFTVQNTMSYNKDFVYLWREPDNSWSGNENTNSEFSKTEYPEGEFTLGRSFSDKPTLYPKKNADKTVLNEMGITSEGYIPNNSRRIFSSL